MMSVVLLLGLAAGGTDLDELAGRCRFTWTADPATGRQTIVAGNATVVVAPGLQIALVNGATTPLSMPVAVEGGRLKLPPELAGVIERNASAAPPPKEVKPPPPPKLKLPACIVAIDAGHGGIHTGAKGSTGLMEKDINLSVARELRDILEGWGVKVVMTRTEDRHFSSEVDDDLDERVRIVNRARPDVFLSIHTNYVPSSDTRGIEVWVPKDAGESRNRDSRDLASLCRRELRGVWGSEDRGTKDNRNLRVLKDTSCPAALVELEFISNDTVERQLSSAAVRRRLAEALADALRKWILKR